MQGETPPPYSGASSAGAAGFMGGGSGSEASGSGGSSDGVGSEGDGSAEGGSEGSGILPLGPNADPDRADDSPEPSDSPPDEEPPVSVTPVRLENVLVFTRTTGFRHDSIGPGVSALERLGQQNGFAVARTEDPEDFTDESLANYDVVVWLNTDSEVLDDAGRRAFERYIRAGGGWVGVHAAAASEYGWSWYGQLLGAYFLGHPAIQPAQVVVEIGDHASTAHLPQSFTVEDEWYSFRTNPRSSVQVLMTLDESSYSVGDLAMGDHPIAWYHEFDGGRAWYTALGHPVSSYADPVFTGHLLGGIRWAAGAAP
jgi:type 1 glutamine amidotransferase